MAPDAVIALSSVTLGSVLGIAGTLLSQLFGIRRAERLELARRRETIRAERRTLIMDYYEATQEVERLAGDRELIDADYQAAERVTHRLWVCHKRLALVASDPLQDALIGLSDRLNQAIWEGLDGQRPHEFIRDATYNFMRVAQQEAGPLEH